MVGRAGLAGEIGGPGAGQQHRLVLGLRHIQHGEADGGVHEIGDRIDLIDVEPAVGDGDAHIRLVLMVARENFDGGAIDLAAHLLGRHARRLDGAIAGVLLVSAGQISQNADADAAIGNLRLRGRGQQSGDGGRPQKSPEQHVKPSPNWPR